ncbi:MAG: DUF1700 domain-containing protein [Turicibacter sp.]|nr:DUF1700 domain-containing protein [Turicibacter sp.]
MTKYNFLNELERRLAKLPEEDRVEILRDYEEHFESAQEAGRSDAEVMASLGSPEKIAKEVAAEHHIEFARETSDVSSVFRAVFAVGALGFFNLIFVLAPALAVGSVIFAIGVSGVAFVASPILLLVFSAVGLQTFTWLEFFTSIAMSGVGVFLTIATYYLTRWAIKLTTSYLAMNLRLVRGGRN